ncbi:MAG: hypothetical protein V1750_06185, partial [Acidobacteriota bacterium]
EQPVPLARWMGFGAFLGLTILARTDLGLLAPFLAGAVLVRSRRQLPLALTRICAMAVPALLVTAPWFIWSLIRTGHLVQTSGLADPLVFYREIEAWGYPRLPAWLWWNRSWQCLNEAWRGIHWHLASFPLLAGVGLTLAASFLLQRSSELRRIGRQLGRTWPILAVALAVVLVDSLIRWYPRRWHMAPASLWLALATALGSAAVLRLVTRRWLAMLLFALLLGGPLLGQHWQVWGKIARSEPPFQRAGALALLADLERSWPAGAVIGHSDCGIMSYYAQKISVVNLDGVINAEAYDALKNRDLMGYILRRKIDAFWLRDGLIIPELTGVRFFEQNDFRGTFIRPWPRFDPGQIALSADGLRLDRNLGLRFFRGGLETSPRGPSDGTFTLGHLTKLAFQLPPQSRPEDFVGAELFASAVLGSHQDVRVLLNGRSATTLTLTRRPARRAHPFALPPGLLRRGINSLALVFPSVSSPAELRFSNDVRQISANLFGFRLLRERPPHPAAHRAP